MTDRGIACPRCWKYGTKIIDSTPEHGYIRRRHQCVHCGARYTTHERLAPDPRIVKQHFGSGRLCTDCLHWQPHRCGLGFPDPLEDGLSVAEDCAAFSARASK